VRLEAKGAGAFVQLEDVGLGRDLNPLLVVEVQSNWNIASGVARYEKEVLVLEVSVSFPFQNSLYEILSMLYKKF
jgi:hypothetical protein